jgi:hypothetical protein
MPNPKYSICLDMNGVLLARYYWNDPTRPTREPDYRLKNHLVYLRPGFKKFINVMLHNFNVGIWSSVSKDNLDILCKTIFTPEQLKRLRFILDGSYCTLIPNDESEGSQANRVAEGSQKPIMLKETSKLFGLYGIDPEHVVLVDDSEYKAALNTSGISIHPSSYIGDINDKALCKNGEIYKELMTLLEKV